MIKLVLFKLCSDTIRFAIKAKYVWALWITLCLCSFIVLLRFNVNAAADLVILSFLFFVVSVADRLVYKKITTYVIMNRFMRTLHMNLPEGTVDRHELKSIVLELIEALEKGSRKTKKTYRMKTHQRILDQLLDDKFQEIVSVNYEQSGTGIIYEKVVMVSYSRIWKKKYKKIRTLFLLAPENKFEVQLQFKNSLLVD
ncbi:MULTISPECIES: hypothetical protein [Paenibacillus]|uniref:hypothetical protein n=1 Tax=Paenibacillus TaxID=44249 RepID=UPI0004641827|nr:MULTISPECIES: hypothetical protein [Paenibacillus]KGP77706.1 hypothetical protein P364_0132050 [Paenibacillus sp. MAEPY2]KGP78675.1 hypothetical protein P363_0131870 [Paenibacillus sp. MAEPY1]OZQ62822.1 hypothetical protein CA599_25515 [Paenibacillus taichungensis]